jgi:hypothetical protein
MKASSSTSNLSRPSSSRSKQDMPRSRSKPKDREFMLWIPEPLEDLENIIQSKQRILDLLNYQTETLDKEVQDQLLARDRHISELNRTILDLRSSIKTKDKSKNDVNVEKLIEEQEKNLLDARKEKSELVEKLEKLENDFNKAVREWDEEKEQLEYLTAPSKKKRKD